MASSLNLHRVKKITQLSFSRLFVPGFHHQATARKQNDCRKEAKKVNKQTKITAITSKDYKVETHCCFPY